MSKVISEEMERLLATGSTLRAMFEEGKKMRAEFGDDDVYDFSLGNPNTPPPPEFNEALIETVKTTPSFMLHGYMSNAGYEVSRQAIADDLNKRFGTNFAMHNISMTVGAANALVVALKILINPGDEVVVLAPFFLEYRNYISNFGGLTKVVPPNKPTFRPDYNAIKAAINEKTRAIIIDNPNNPSGIVYNEEDIKVIANVLEEASKEYKRPIFLISDEPYREIVYDGVEVPFLTKYYKNTLLCYSFSKSMSISGERVGYLAIPDEAEESERIIAASSIGIRVTGCVNAPSLQQLAITKCLGKFTDINIYDKNRKALMGAFDEAGLEYVKPEGTFYMFVKSPIEDDHEFVRIAKDKYHVLCSAGDAFDCPGYVRFAYCVDYEMIMRAKDKIIALGKEFSSK